MFLPRLKIHRDYLDLLYWTAREIYPDWDEWWAGNGPDGMCWLIISKKEEERRWGFHREQFTNVFDRQRMAETIAGVIRP